MSKQAPTTPFRAKYNPQLLATSATSTASLELKIKQLVEEYNTLRGENAHLKRMLSNKSSELYRLKGKLADLEQKLEKLERLETPNG